MRVVVVSLLALATAGGAFALPGKARLETVSQTPLVLRGTNFQPSERVTLLVGAERTFRKTAVADASGRFTIRFPVSVARCSGFVAQAVGSKGSRARTLPSRHTMCGAGSTT